MPDVGQIFVFLVQVFETPIQMVGSLIVALVLILYVLDRLIKLLTK